ncbi:MAG: T9SS type A sorting domain-containing protein, partial [Sphingobacteriales bacterium]
GLLASYHCDEASGSILVNATGGTNGTLFNSPVWTASPIVYSGNALSIDGIDDQVTVPHPISGDFTLEYLMKTSATGINGSQWFHGSGIIDAEVGGQTYDWGTSLLGSRLAFGIGGPGIDRTAISTIDVNTGNWVHVAVSWRQSTGEVKMYIDGVDQGSFSPTSTQPRSAPTRIVFGSLQTNSRFYTGAIDEVRIWNVVRTQAEIQADMNKELKPATATSLLAYYTFDQGLPAGTNPGLNTIYDLKGNNNGVLNNFALTGTSSNYIAQNNALITLPLQWLKFTAYQVQATRQVKLEWTTGAELNTKDFLVQHSINSTDWNNIAVLPSAGINTGQAQYSFVHKEPALSANYYRILQRDIDNRTSYSPVQLVNLKAAREGLVIINPRVNTGILQLRLAEAASISIFNTTGHLMKQLQFNAGTQVINVHQFPKGIYVLSNGMEAKKFFVE